LKKKIVFLTLLAMLCVDITLYAEPAGNAEQQPKNKIDINNLKSESLQFIDNLLNNMQTAKTDYELKIKQLNDNLENSAAKIKELESQIAKLKDENKSLADINQQIPILKKKIADLENDNISLSNEITALKGKGVDEIKTLNAKFAELIQAYSHSEIELKNLKIELENKSAAIQNQNTLITKLEESLKSADSAKREYLDKINSLTADCESLSARLSETDRRFAAIKDLNDTLTSANSVFQKENSYLAERIKQLNKDKELMIIETTKNQEIINKNRADAAKYESEIIKRDGDIEFLKNTTKQQADKIKDLSAETARLNADIKQGILDKQSLEFKIKDMQNALTDYDTIVLSLKQKIKDLQTELEKANSFKNLYERALKERELQASEMDIIKNERNQLKISLNQNSKDMEKLKATIDEKNKTIEQQKIELNKLYDKLKELIK